jgi:Domain of unknown function (4846)
MNSKSLLVCLLVLANACGNSAETIPKKIVEKKTKNSGIIENPFLTVNEIPTPINFKRVSILENSFGEWLRAVKLKKDKTVFLFDGTEKINQAAQFAVLDFSVGTKNLQQCADAVMRLRAEYLYSKKLFEQIIFIDNEQKKYQFTTPFNRIHFDEYLQKVFGMCGTASLAKQLIPKNDFNAIEIGDVIVKGGFPGHAVMVMDVAENNNGEKIYLLAQSYMPAQDIHLLNNPNEPENSPWYTVSKNELIVTPEYIFTKTHLMNW